MNNSMDDEYQGIMKIKNKIIKNENFFSFPKVLMAILFWITRKKNKISNLSAFINNQNKKYI